MIIFRQRLDYAILSGRSLFIYAFLLILILLLGACDDGNNVLSGDIAPDDTPGDTSSDKSPPDFGSGPTVAMAPNPDTPLAGLLEFTTNEPAKATVVISNAGLVNTNALGSGVREWTIESDDFVTEHSIILLGFTPAQTFDIGVLITDEAGNETELQQNLVVSTDPLPDGFPQIQVESKPEMMEPGVTIFPVRGSGANSQFGGAIVAVDETGQVVWYRHNFQDIAFGDVRRMSNGNLLYNDSFTNIVEINMLGDVVNEWKTLRSNVLEPESLILDTEYVHHEVFEMTNGNFLVLGVELRVIDNYPSSDSDPFAPLETATVAGDTVVEFTPDGTVVNEWSFLDMLDPFRIAYNSLGGFWNARFPEIEGGTRDWSHGNAVIHDPIDNSIIVSLRHQDAVVKFSRETGELIWILGPHENWDMNLFGGFLLEPVGEDFLWQYHQHAPMITPEGNILLFDNGNFRASPFDEQLPATENFSRAVEYSINEDTREVTQVWEYGQFVDEPLYAPFIGDADYLPQTGNVLISFGGVTGDEEGNPTDVIGSGSKTAVHLIEVTHTEPAEKVFELTIVDPTPELANGWTTYRAERLPSLYP